jgi:hypothetical protein
MNKLTEYGLNAMLVLLFGVLMFALVQLAIDAVYESNWVAIALISLGGMFAVATYTKAKGLIENTEGTES